MHSWSVCLLLLAAWLDHCGGLFGWGSSESASPRALVESSPYGCVAFKSVSGCKAASEPESVADGPDKPCRSTITSRQSGFCMCAWGETERVDCGHAAFNCEQTCYDDFRSRKTSKEHAWLKNSIWNWNNWREVKLERDGTFHAPEPNCMNGECYWFATEGVVYILWGQAGLHSVTISADNTSVSGMRFNGEKCSAALVRKEGSGSEVEEEDEEEDLYEILGLDPDEASESDIKKAYRRLSLDFHPDRVAQKGLDPEQSAKRFDKIRNANEILSNGDTRLLYDTGGMEAVKEYIANKDRKGRGGGGIFGMFFGGGDGGGNRGRDQEYYLKVSLNDMYNGNTEMRTSIDRRIVCRGCSKPTPKNRERCGKCARCPPEVRTVQRQMGGFIVNQQEQVPSKEKCRNEPAKLEVVIERGMKEGDRLTFARMAEQSPGQVPGDIILQLQQADNQQFRRDGDNLFTVVHLSLKEALAGFSHEFKHLDDHLVELESSPGQVISHGSQRRLQGEGMPVHNVPSQFGDLVVEFDVRFPDVLSPEQKKALREILP